MIRLRDAALPGLLGVLTTAELAATRYPSWGWAVLVELVACGLLVLRHRAPLVAPMAALFVSNTTPFIDQQLDQPAAPVAIAIVAIFTMSRLNDDPRSALLVLALFIPAAAYAGQREDADLTDLVFVGALVVPPYVLGRVVRRLAEQTEQLQAQQEIVRREAVRDERDRIARDLHDVIAHSISAMVVQTAAAQDLLDRDPGKVAELLDNVARTGREALAETAQLLHVIRDDSDELGLAPAPGLARLDELIEVHRVSGLEVDSSVGAFASLPPGTDVSAYRIVQEALTNAARHSADGRVALRVAAQDGRLVIETTNWAGARPSPGGGLGLVGMAERLKVLGGDLVHGTNAEGRFVLTASLPLESAR